MLQLYHTIIQRNSRILVPCHSVQIPEVIQRNIIIGFCRYRTYIAAFGLFIISKLFQDHTHITECFMVERIMNSGIKIMPESFRVLFLRHMFFTHFKTLVGLFFVGLSNGFSIWPVDCKIFRLWPFLKLPNHKLYFKRYIYEFTYKQFPSMLVTSFLPL